MYPSIERRDAAHVLSGASKVETDVAVVEEGDLIFKRDEASKEGDFVFKRYVSL